MPVNRTEAVSEALIHVSDKLGYGVQELYQVYTKGQAVEGMVTLVVTAGVLGFAALSSAVVYRKGRQLEEDSKVEFDAEDKTGFTVAAGLAVLMIGVFVAAAVHPALVQIFAPEYMAAKELVQAAGGAIQ
ncbi:hypothetical protein SAMN05443574_12413 [Haloarcula vallismortis]|uniref:Uncharacterized protein n=2 Tax=Haloarcula vallismortis TaxID=28442 RepID=M0JLS4_HALVA|nr:hypothetical protein [Haloarcula vallismortis]EMA09956.1 hypothetical protein C437_04845 [Haloarcula vallismortis ATCC 29715]SDX27808.1 hypothetical protein SAMN05443574_12413 [Haloarcula vallismortis]